MMTKTKPNKVRPVTFNRIRVGQQCRLNGELVHKFGPKRGMTPKGEVRLIPDATLVVPVVKAGG